MRKFLCALALSVAIPYTIALAETEHTYTLQPTEDGYVRTNTKTGATSICRQTGQQLICRMALDDQTAFEADIADLTLKIDQLEKRLAILEKSGSPNLSLEKQPESEFEFQTSLNRMEQFFRRFMGIVKEFQYFSPEPSPDRT